MEVMLIFCCILLLSVGVFIFPLRRRHAWAMLLALAAGVVVSIPAVQVLFMDVAWKLSSVRLGTSLTPALEMDKLSALFVLIVVFTWITGLWFAGGYLKPYYRTKSSLQISLHFFSYLWLGFSMIMVAVAQDFISFLIVWELMTLSSFLLVIFDAEERSVLKAGVNYLIQMHIGLLFLIAAMLIAYTTDSIIMFKYLSVYFSSHSNFILFLLFFIGFGIKAGFVPFHSWLPRAHPAAPSHVSGVMSGVMIKMGIYGILRVLLSVQTDLMDIGLMILGVSLLSGIYGVLHANVQRDIKKMLAFSSIENIGIIGIGIGIGVIGLDLQLPVLTFLGFSGALLHIFNHSLFKSIMFFSAGRVYQATHTRDIDQLGGLIKRMPWTAVFFLVGSLAICAFPPFNGFISEYLLYTGMFTSLVSAPFYTTVILIISIAGLALIGGLALFGFTRVFGIMFLGEARSDKVAHAAEPDASGRFPLLLIALLILAIGLGPVLFAEPVFGVVSSAFPTTALFAKASGFMQNLQSISIVAGVFVLLTLILLLFRKLHLKNKPVESGPTWGCGYTAASSKVQYTGQSFSDNLAGIAQPLLQTKKTEPVIPPDDLFPQQATYESKPRDVVQEKWIDAPTNRIAEWLKMMARMQTGRIEHYILYAFAFIALLFLLTYFNLI